MADGWRRVAATAFFESGTSLPGRWRLWLRPGSRRDGKGIPPEILPKLGQRGQSFNKERGSGLGLYHARTSIERWGGNLELKSTVGVGTTVKLVFPKATPPEWFVPALEVQEGKTIVVVDDDASIHQIWEKRFIRSAGEPKLPIIHFSTPEQLLQWNPGAEDRGALYLVDYEFIGKSENGLFLIESLGIEIGTRLSRSCEHSGIIACSYRFPKQTGSDSESRRRWRISKCGYTCAANSSEERHSENSRQELDSHFWLK